MKKAELKQIREKMIAALATEYKRYACDRVRCPSLKKMAQYINEAVDGFTAVLDDWSEYKGRQLSSGVYYTRQSYDGHRLTITDEKTKVVVKEHCSTETYRRNTDIARVILCELEKKDELDLTDAYRKKINGGVKCR